MLKLLKKISPSHEDLFIEHYQRLRAWSLQLTEHDRDMAEDLLQDAFIHFTTLTQPDLKSIHNLDGYFYGMLRNLHLSQERRSSRSRFQQLSIVEYESAATGLRVMDARDVIQVQDELRRICHYACARKETAKLASVLILRFFHGYYPSEIARILRSPRPAIDKWLQLARAEAKLAITDQSSPNALRFKDAMPAVDFLPASIARTSQDLLNEIQQQIFQTRHGGCATRNELARFYQAKQPPGEIAPMDCEQLSHVVSCPQCLNEINTMLKLPPLSERYPTDSIGKDTTPKGGGGSGEGPGGTGGGETPKTAVRRYRRRAREAFEHRPQELCVSVNGYIQGSHRIGSDKVELDLSANLAEAVSFVEVFSEQGIRLLLLNAEEPPPHGADVQTSSAKLSDGRTLALTLKLRSPWPTLHLVYDDPTFKAVESGVWNQQSGVESLESGVEAEVQSLGGSPTVREGSGIEVQSPKSKVQRPGNTRIQFKQRFRARLADIGHWTLDLGLLLRPATVTVVLAALILALFFSLRKPLAPIAASDLLARASVAEDVLAARRDQVIHRTITLEQRRADNLEEKKSTGELIARQKIEIWQSAERGITARRLYDEKGALIAGDWRRSDGVQTLYHHGAQPKLQPLPEKREATAPSFDSVWQLSPSAKEFSSLIGNSGPARVEEQQRAYVISYRRPGALEDSASALSSGSGRGPAPADPGGKKAAGASPLPNLSSGPGVLIQARIVLTKADLHAVEQTLIVQQGDETREYKFTETNFEQKPPSAVARSVFEPDPELISPAKPEAPNSKLETVSPLPVSPVPPAASAALEVELLERLNQVNAFLGEQLSVSRTTDGRLRVEGVVDTPARKAELLRALGPVGKNPAVHVAIDTVAEAQVRQAKKQQSTTVTLQGVEVTEQRIAVDVELRRYLSGRGLSGDQLEVEMRRFTDRVLQRSLQARLHARALKQIAGRFSASQLATLDHAARTRWRTMISQHARACQQDIEALRRELQPLFPIPGGATTAESPIAGDEAVLQAVSRLYALSVANDESLRRSFSLYAERPVDAPVRTAQFWRSLSGAENLASKIATSQ